MNKNNYKDIKIKGKLLKNDVYWMMNKLKISEHDEGIFFFLIIILFLQMHYKTLHLQIAVELLISFTY